MKKTIAIVLTVIFVISILAGCGTEKLDTSPHSFGAEEAASAVLPAPDDALPDGAEEVPEEVRTEKAVEAPAEAEPSEEAANAEALDVDALPLEPAGDDNIGPAEGPLAAGSDGEAATPYALDGEEETQAFESPAAEAEALGLDSIPAEKSLPSDAAVPGDTPEDPENLDNLPLEPAGDDNIGPAEGPLGALPGDEASPNENEEVFVPSESDLAFADSVAGQAFAVAMTYWDSSYGVETSPSDSAFAWEALGWYSAWIYRTRELDLMPADTAQAFLASLGCENTDLKPEEVMDYGMPQVFRGRDGVSYDFGWFRDRIDELLGTEVEVSIDPSAAQTVNATVTQHFAGGLQGETVYTLGFEAGEQTDGEFPWVLKSVTLPDFAPEVDPALTFTWEEVEQANRLGSVLEAYPAVCMYSREFPENGNTWLFSRNGNPALVVEGPDYCSGQYRGCWFDYEKDDAGVVRARIGAFDTTAGSWEALDSMLLESFRDASVLRLDRIEDNLIWADCLYRGGYREKLAFDRNTLVLRELMVLSEEGEVLGSNCYDYVEAPDFKFLDSWDHSLREVSVTWESYEGQEANRYTETVSIPADWEYLPYECRWGEYTAYTNADYIGDYEYPGDNVDYELFLTTAKG